MKIKYLFYSITCAICFVISYKYGIPIWFLFIGLAFYYGYLALHWGKPVKMDSTSDQKIIYGVLGNYDVDGEVEDLSYGLYIRLRGCPVFVDIREDAHLEQRKAFARKLFDGSQVLEGNLGNFLQHNHEFQSRRISSIGLHADQMDRGEVFWNPVGYSLLLGLEFAPPNDVHSK